MPSDLRHRDFTPCAGPFYRCLDSSVFMDIAKSESRIAHFAPNCDDLLFLCANMILVRKLPQADERTKARRLFPRHGGLHNRPDLGSGFATRLDDDMRNCNHDGLRKAITLLEGAFGGFCRSYRVMFCSFDSLASSQELARGRTRRMKTTCGCSMGRHATRGYEGDGRQKYG